MWRRRRLSFRSSCFATIRSPGAPGVMVCGVDAVHQGQDGSAVSAARPALTQAVPVAKEQCLAVVAQRSRNYRATAGPGLRIHLPGGVRLRAPGANLRRSRVHRRAQRFRAQQPHLRGHRCEGIDPGPAEQLQLGGWLGPILDLGFKPEFMEGEATESTSFKHSDYVVPADRVRTKVLAMLGS